jgi:hypothetical protein
VRRDRVQRVVDSGVSHDGRMSGSGNGRRGERWVRCKREEGVWTGGCWGEVWLRLPLVLMMELVKSVGMGRRQGPTPQPAHCRHVTTTQDRMDIERHVTTCTGRWQKCCRLCICEAATREQAFGWQAVSKSKASNATTADSGPQSRRVGEWKAQSRRGPGSAPDGCRLRYPRNTKGM